MNGSIISMVPSEYEQLNTHIKFKILHELVDRAGQEVLCIPVECIGYDVYDILVKDSYFACFR